MERSPIDDSLKRINESYSPGTLAWMKRSRPDDWGRMRSLENRINQAALSGNELMLAAALSDYERFFDEVVPAYQQAEK